MVVTNVGKSGLAMILAGYGPIPNWVGIGSGSGVVSVTNTGLIAETIRSAITGSPDTSTLQQTAYTADFNSVQMSGTGLKEFALFNNATLGSGTTWVREGFQSITFDGTNELEILINLRIF